MVIANGIVDFKKVFQIECDIINQRRLETGRGKIKEFYTKSETGGSPVYDTIGLSLSGGGVRSAAFCLGVLQALDQAKVLDKVDYLSTVSGGGYIGASMTTGMTANGGVFPFGNNTESVSVRHIRRYLNYLIPHGIADVLRNIVVQLRGIVANVILITPVLLALAAITIYINPKVSSLFFANFASLPIPNIFDTKFFVFTRYFLIALIIFLALWALWRSLPGGIGTGEVTSKLLVIFGSASVAVVFSAFCEIQPFVLAGMFNRSGSRFDVFADWKGIFDAFSDVAAGLLASLSIIIGFVSKQLAEVLKRASESSSWWKRFEVRVTKATIYIAGLALPVVLWVVYLKLCYWGILNDGVSPNRYEGPGWITRSANFLFAGTEIPIGWFYLLVSAGFFVLWFVLDPNANSLHRLYRDRISKAFLFKPNTEKGEDDEPEDQDKLKLSELSTKFAPYHLINAAINLQNSRYANKRGRDADFFLFSPQFVGSAATGYLPTKEMESAVRDLDVATAVAISGAAASSNMGSNTIRWLAPTLAMLNIRLGFWLRNPRFVAASLLKRIAADKGHLYFLYEMLGLLNENRWAVYLTDGGHIENLGIYELLKRRCILIIAVDAEADPEMNFNSLIKLERYARIDLGVRIELPWQEIQKIALATGKAMSGDDVKAVAKPYEGPHCAIGKIHYQDGADGILLYVKSSMTGDENDYVRDYKRRHASFPHETTGDQFFSEEQFEVYRALGFHAMQGVITARDLVAITAGPDQERAGVEADKLAKYSMLKPRSDDGFGDPVVDAVFGSLKMPPLKLRSTGKG